jgi:Dolichyl-phosphate-mannose-protein mannosyltransferase
MKSGIRFVIFILLIAGYFFLVGYTKILFYRPQSIHQWAQCDRASVALNYLHNGFDFFHPQTNNISNGSGITGLEFPFLNFIAAIGYNYFGYHEYIYRLLVFLFLLFGLLMAYLISDRFIENKLLVPLPALLLAASPVLSYYAISFLPEAASLGLSLIAWYYFLKNESTGKSNFPISVIFYCTLAALVKISSLINPLAMAGYLLLKNRKSSLQQTVRILLPAIFILIPVFAWYYYASWLNNHYHSNIFMLEVRPLSSWAEFKTVGEEIIQTWWWRFYPRIYFLVLLFSSAMIAFLPIKVDIRLLRVTLLLYIGAFAFCILMFSQFRVHDYYIIPLMPAFFFHWVLFCRAYSTTEVKPAIKYAFMFFMVTATGFSISDAKDHLRTAHKKTSWKYGSRTFDHYFYLEPELRRINIKPTDGVVSIFDQSFNVSLYLMNQKGITVGPLTPVDTIVNTIKKSGLPYAILNNFNPQRFDVVMDSLQLGKRILEWNELTVYKLNPTNKNLE